MPPMSLKRHRTHQPTPFQLKKEIRRGKSQKKAKGAAGGARPPCGGQAARSLTRSFAGKRFGLERKIAPKQYFYGNCRPRGRFFLGFGAAKPRDLEGGVRKWGAACLLYTSPSPRDRTRSRMPSSA